jgi:hypothetical protein
MKINEVTRIKLGQPRTDNTTKFIEDYYKLTSEHPFSEKIRVFGNVMLELYPFNGNIHLSDIRTMAPKSGAATNAIKMLTELADRNHVKLELIAKPYSKDKQHITDIEVLVNFYKKHGFTVDEDFDDEDGYEGFDEVGMTYFPR